MKYFYRGAEIHNKTEWKNAFCSAYSGKDDDKHWKEGRSGECLAEDFMGNNPHGEESIAEMVKRFLNTSNVNLEKANIEHASVFDSHPRPRMQDLAIWGNVDGKRFFVGVEAKVDEEFGSKSVAQQRNYVKGLTETEADKRLDELVKDYLDGEEEKNGKLRYQLLYYLAGSFCETDSDIVFMPVVVYQTRAERLNLYSSTKGDKNKKAYTDFMEALHFTPVDNVPGGEIKLAYHKKVTAHGITKDVYTCYIVK